MVECFDAVPQPLWPGAVHSCMHVGIHGNQKTLLHGLGTQGCLSTQDSRRLHACMEAAHSCCRQGATAEAAWLLPVLLSQAAQQETCTTRKHHATSSYMGCPAILCYGWAQHVVLYTAHVVGEIMASCTHGLLLCAGSLMPNPSKARHHYRSCKHYSQAPTWHLIAMMLELAQPTGQS